MKERPILFSGPMVRAILGGSKTQTRRAIKPQPEMLDSGDCRVRINRDWHTGPADYLTLDVMPRFACPYGQPGDRLWVREAFSGPHCMERTDECPALPPGQWPVESEIWYWADGGPTHGDWTRPRPSIHMPRWASRITLEITDVRVERLRDISEEDAMAEGCDAPLYVADGLGNQVPPDRETLSSAYPSSKHWFSCLWESINGTDSWSANPWIWVVEFKRIEK